MTNPDPVRNEILVTVASRPSELEAAILVNVLQDEGIRAVAMGGFTAGFRAEAPGWVQVRTFASDAEAACTIIAELKSISFDQLNEHDVLSEQGVDFNDEFG